MRMLLLWLGIFAFLLPPISFAQQMTDEARRDGAPPQQSSISEEDLNLLTVVAAYVNGFKEFDTSVYVLNASVSVGIYYDGKAQVLERAESLARRFRDQVPTLVQRHGFSSVRVTVSVYREDRTSGY